LGQEKTGGKLGKNHTRHALPEQAERPVHFGGNPTNEEGVTGNGNIYIPKNYRDYEKAVW